MGHDQGIFEGSARRLRRVNKRVLSRVLLASLTIALIATAALWVGSSQPTPTRPPPPLSPTSTPSDSPTPSPSSVGARLTGTGPFIIFQLNDSDGPFYTVDISAPQRGKILLGIPLGQTMFIVNQAQVWGRIAPIPIQTFVAQDGTATDVTTRYWLLRNGFGFDDRPVTFHGDPMRWLASPDGKRLIAVEFTPGTNAKYSDLILVPTDGSTPRKLSRILTSGAKNEDGILTPLVWLPRGGWLGMPICQCEAGPQSWYKISSQGKVSRASWLGFPRDGTPGVSADGHYLSIFDQPTKDCGSNGFKLCADGPVRVLLADTVNQRMRVLATYNNDVRDTEDPAENSTAITADGTLVATSLSGLNPVKVIDAHTARVVTTISYRDYNLRPLAFLDKSTLLLRNDNSIFAARIEFGGTVHVTEILRGQFLYAGWTR